MSGMIADFDELIALYNSTPQELEAWARKNQHTYLYGCIQTYRAGRCTWDEAMKAAAINQAVAVADLKQKLIELNNVTLRPIFVPRGEH